MDDPFEQYLCQVGAASRDELIARTGRHRFDNAVKAGRLVAVFPRSYALPWMADHAAVRRRAALASVGGETAFSHVSTLEAYELPIPGDYPLHVTGYLPRHPRGVPGELVVHRSRRPLKARSVSGFPVVPLADALVASWPLLRGPDQRAPLLEAWRRRLVSGQALADQLDNMWWVADRARLKDVVALLLAGCESPLEMWGYTSVFSVPGLDDAARQLVVRVRGKTYRLDMAYEDEKVNVELDGRRYHAAPEQWERDIARDMAVATVGWQTLRFSHRRLREEVNECRRDVLAVRAQRRPR
jgi:hypothetical protein